MYNLKYKGKYVVKVSSYSSDSFCEFDGDSWYKTNFIEDVTFFDTREEAERAKKVLLDFGERWVEVERVKGVYLETYG